MHDFKSVITKDDFLFPRGKSEDLSPLEIKEISVKAYKDALFEFNDDKKKRKKNIIEKSTNKRKKHRIEENVADISTKNKIFNINFKTLSLDSLVLGKILKVNINGLILSIGNNLTGYVNVENISNEIKKLLEEISTNDELIETKMVKNNEDNKIKNHVKGLNLSEFFKPGEWLQAIVIAKNTVTKKIQLSINPTDVNKGIKKNEILNGYHLQCSIKSVEDHGFLLNTGLNFNGFVLFSEFKMNKIFDFKSVKVGYVVICVVTSNSSSKILSLKFIDYNMKNIKAIETLTTVDSLRPGMVVNSVLKSIKKDGLTLLTFGHLNSSIDLINIDLNNIKDFDEKYHEDSTIKCRIIAILQVNDEKHLMLSLIPSVLSLEFPLKNTSLNLFPIGFINDFKIEKMDSNFFYVKVGSHCFGLVHNSQICSTKVLETDYKVNSIHKGRITSYSHIDDIFVISFDPKIIKLPFLYHTQIPDGYFSNKIIIKDFLPNNGGLIVEVFGFKGFVFLNHVSDFRLNNIEKKFKIGETVSGRILNKKGKSLYITMKKTIVDCPEDLIVLSFDDITLEKKIIGTVEKFLNKNVLISFFGNLKGFLPRHQISETYVSHPSDHLRIGQSLQVKVISFDVNKNSLQVSARLSNEMIEVEEAKFNELEVGKSIFVGVVIEKLKDSLIVVIEGSSIRCVLEVGHLSDDNLEQNRSKIKKISVDDTIEVLLLEKKFGSRHLIVTAKKSLIQASKENCFPSHFDQLKLDNKVLVGFVKSVSSLGIFISFSGNLVGLALSKYFQNENVDYINKFQKFKTVRCKLLLIDSEKKRFLITLNNDEKKLDDLKSEIVINPIDNNKKIVNDYIIDSSTKVKITSVKSNQLNVQLADNLHGRIDITQVFDSWDEIENVQNPLSIYKKNDIIEAKVVGYHNFRDHKFLPITYKTTNKNKLFELSKLKSVINSNDIYSNDFSIEEIKQKKNLFAFINNIVNGFIWVSITPVYKGKISFIDFTNDPVLFQDFQKKITKGHALKVKIKNYDEEHQVFNLISKEKELNDIDDLEVNFRYPARILTIKESYLLLELSENIIASSYITDALNDYLDKLDAIFQKNEYTVVTVLSINKENKKVHVSLRNDQAVDKLISSVDDLKKGDILKGFVKNISDTGIYVSLGRKIFAYVNVSNLSDSYLKDWKTYFKIHQMVKGKILSCEKEGQILMTLKDSEINNKNLLKKFDDLKVDDIFEGTVRNITDFGIFINLNNTVNLNGFCHRSNISDNMDIDFKSLFSLNDAVKVKILNINEKKKQISLGLKASFFLNDDDDSSDENVSLVNQIDTFFDKKLTSNNVFHNTELEADNDFCIKSETKSKIKLNLMSLDGFDWLGSVFEKTNNDTLSSDGETHLKKKKKLSDSILDKTGDLNVKLPESVTDFERFLIGSPNSSPLWINYISFFLKLSEIEKAREIAERALKTINYREEKEKLNVWIAYLNLENVFGTDETLNDVFLRASKQLDSLTIHKKFLSMLISSKKHLEADLLFKKMLKKFNSDESVWCNYGRYLFQQNKIDDVTTLLNNALISLPKYKHVEVVKKFSLLHFNFNNSETGRLLFEGLILDLPKKFDIWNVYIDQEIKQNNNSNVKNLFERLFNKKLSQKQAKFFFSKWLNYEQERNDSTMVSYVKNKAIEYVNLYFKKN